MGIRAAIQSCTINSLEIEKRSGVCEKRRFYFVKNSVNIFRFSKVKKKENVSKKQIEDDPILSLLLENDLSFDELVIKTKMSASSLSSQLIKLEMKGYTERDISGKYTLKI